jgi:hypothetical protein
MKQDSVSFASVFAIAALLLPGCDIQWDLEEVAPQRTYAEHVAYGEDGSIVVFTGAGIMLHDAELASSAGAIELDATPGGALHGVPFSFAMSDDGTVAAVTFAATLERDVVLYDLASLTELTTLDIESEAAPVQGVALDPTAQRVFDRGEHWGMFDVACSPAGDVCASALVQGLATPELEYSIALWSTRDGALLHELPTFANGLAFSPDGAFVAVAGGTAQLFHVENGSRVSAVAYDYGDF